jgi:hypothetical protein
MDKKIIKAANTDGLVKCLPASPVNGDKFVLA